MSDRIMRLSIIIPVHDEGDRIATALDAFAELRVLGTELIVADGGSHDATIQRARLRADVVVPAARGLASQWNAGAEKASGEVVLFLRSYMQLPPLADHLILDGLTRSRRDWGYFATKLAGRSLLLPIAGFLINLQARITGMAGKEQAVFVKRSVFKAVGGFTAAPELENALLCKRLKRISRPLRLRPRIVTPAHGWDTNGFIKTFQERSGRRLDFAMHGRGVKADESHITLDRDS